MKKREMIGHIYRTLCILCFKVAAVIPDELYLRIIYFIRMKRILHLRNPQSFNEKIQWLKIYDRNPLYTTLADKYEVRNYVANKIGEQYLIPLIGVYDDFDAINFKELPKAFVIKCTHDSGGLVICRNKSELKIKKVKRKVTNCLNRNFFWKGREWPYKNINPRIIIEKYMYDNNIEDERMGLTDYKFYCFSGEPKYLYVSRGLEDHATANISFYTMDFEPAEFCRKDYKTFTQKIEKPKKFEDMKKLARILSQGIAFSRIDLYMIEEQIFFSEITLHPVSGFMPFEPEQYDRILGDMINLELTKIRYEDIV